MTDQLPKSVPNDRDCMRAIARGDTYELGRLYERHKDNVLSLAFRILGKWNLAEDICQETFLRVQHAAKTYKPEAEFTTWLYRIVVNLCLDEKRRQSRFSVNIKAIDTFPEPAAYRMAEKDSQELHAVVKQALQKLNDRQRTAVILHKIEGLSHAEISLKTGWTPASVESLLVRAYKNLRKEINASIKKKTFIEF